MSIPILAALFPSSCYLISSFLLSLSRDGSMPPHLPYTWFNTQSSKLHRCCSGCPLKPDWGSASWDLVMMMILYRRLTRAGPTFQHVTPSATTLVVNIAKHKYVWHPVEQRKSVGRLSWSEGSAKDWLWWQHTEKKNFCCQTEEKIMYSLTTATHASFSLFITPFQLFCFLSIWGAWVRPYTHTHRWILMHFDLSNGRISTESFCYYLGVLNSKEQVRGQRE